LRGSDLAFDLRRGAGVLRATFRLVAWELGRRALRRPLTRETGVRLREALERLGLTYLKLGQYLATRFDLLPPEITEELNRLFDRVPPVPYEQIRAVVEAELDGPIEELFDRFEPQALAAASVAQVHEAVTVDGERVAVKIQRPGIERTFRSDMRNLRRQARVADALGLLGALSAREVADTFAMWTGRELDFRIEARTAIRLRENALPYEVVPRVHTELSSSRVIVLEYIEGPTLNDLVALLEEGGTERVLESYPGFDLDLAMRRLAFACLNQIFVNGFFHGDPHPANIIVPEDNSAAFVDFGIFGELTAYERELLARLVEHIATGNAEGAFRAYAALADPTESTDVAAFEREGIDLFRRWYEAASDERSGVGDRHLGKYSGEMTEIVRRHRLRMGAQTLLFWRSLNVLDATALRAASHFDLLAILREFFDEVRGGPARRVDEVLKDPRVRVAGKELLREAPVRVLTVLNRLARAEPLPVFDEEAPREARDATRRAGLVAAPLVLASAFAAAGAADLPPAAAATLAASGALVAATLTLPRRSWRRTR
jgi:ubiquinone biosynthesis protein